MVSIARRMTLILFIAAILSACASTGGADRGKARMDVITREQIMETGANNLFEVVSRLRPRWLQVNSTRSFSMETEIVVFQNEMLLGGPDALKQMSLELAFEMRWMDGPLATASLPGLMSGRHIEGAIIISTRPIGGF